MQGWCEHRETRSEWAAGLSTPHRFRRRPRTARYRARSAMRGAAGQLFGALGSGAYLFTLHVADLGLSKAHSSPSALYDHERMAEWRAAASGAFAGPVMVVLEVGKGSEGKRGQTHAHVIAHYEDGPQHLRRGSERCKHVYDPEGLLVYLQKPPEPYSLEAEIDYRAGKVLSPNRKAPRTRMTLLGASRLTWLLELNGTIARNSAKPHPQSRSRRLIAEAEFTEITPDAVPAERSEQAPEFTEITPDLVPTWGTTLNADSEAVSGPAISGRPALTRYQVQRIVRRVLRHHASRPLRPSVSSPSPRALSIMLSAPLTAHPALLGPSRAVNRAGPRTPALIASRPPRGPPVRDRLEAR